jgi:hypothetical protein
MRFSSFLAENENYMGQLKNDINVYLTRMKANGINTIGTDLLVKELEGLGHSLTVESLVDLLANNKYVSRATIDSVDLVGSPTSSGQDTAKDREKVHNLAVKAAKKGLK